jgi:hypothetical protein
MPAPLTATAGAHVVAEPTAVVATPTAATAATATAVAHAPATNNKFKCPLCIFAAKSMAGLSAHKRSFHTTTPAGSRARGG